MLTSVSVLGAIWGSFVAALCSRWPIGESVAKGRSRCDQCGSQIASYDLVPVISFLLLKGKCRNCAHSIGLQPFAIELVAVLIGVTPFLLLPESQATAAAIFGWLLLPLILLDYQHFWLPDHLVLLLAIAGFLVGPMLVPDVDRVARVAGLLTGFLSLEIVRQVYKQYRQHDGMGAGDPKLFAALGIWLGWQALPIILLSGSAIGLLSVLALHLRAKHHRTAFPFGSFLGVAAYVAVVIG